MNQSKILGDYDKTNIWKIPPASSKDHPAIFPSKLVSKVISYYSFINDVILDPFAGIGTTAKVASELKRRFIIFEIKEEYINSCRRYFKSKNQLNKIKFI